MNKIETPCNKQKIESTDQLCKYDKIPQRAKMLRKSMQDMGIGNVERCSQERKHENQKRKRKMSH